jgi:nucleotide-binding universal stress UspA family protein
MIEMSLVAVASVFGGWAASGLVTAWVLARRGHDGRGLGVLGVVFGPLLVGLAIDVVRRRERAVRPIVLAAGGIGPGRHDVLVGVLGPASDAADAISALATMAGGVRRVTLAAMVDFESVERGSRSAAATEPARELERAALFLSDYTPSLVLLGGRPAEALCAFAEAEGYDVVVVTGAGRAVGSLHRRLVDERRPTVLVAGEPRPGDH